MHSGSVLKQPTLNYHQLQLAGCDAYTMPRTFSLFSIRHTTIILVDSGNLYMIQGDFRHIDHRSIVRTTITNRDVYNIESPVTKKQMPLTTSLGNDGKDIIET